MTIIIKICIFITTCLHIVYARPQVDELCSNVETTDIGRCLRPLLDRWETVRETETHAAGLLFPVPFYTEDTLMRLCTAYRSANDDCMLEQLNERCEDNDLVSFVHRHLGFVCGSSSSMVMDHFSCISSSLLKSRHCQRHIIGVPTYANKEDTCNGAKHFYDCAESRLMKDCGRKGHAIFTLAVEHFGCRVLNGENRQEARAVLRSLSGIDILRAPLPRRVEKGTPLNSKLFLDDQNEVEIMFAEDQVHEVASGDQKQPRTNDEAIEGSGVDVQESDDKKPSKTTPTAVPKHVSPPSAKPPPIVRKCDKELSTRLTECYLPITDRIEDLRAALPLSIRYPLFNVSVTDVLQICEMYKEKVNSCLTMDIKRRCSSLQMVAFVDEQLGAICAATRRGDHIKQTIECVREAMSHKSVCLVPLEGIFTPDLTVKEKCVGQQQVADCVLPRVAAKCGFAGLQLYSDILDGFGCAVNFKLPSNLLRVRAPPRAPASTPTTSGSISSEQPIIVSSTGSPTSTSTSTVATSTLSVTSTTSMTSTTPTTPTTTTTEARSTIATISIEGDWEDENSNGNSTVVEGDIVTEAGNTTVAAESNNDEERGSNVNEDTDETVTSQERPTITTNSQKAVLNGAPTADDVKKITSEFLTVTPDILESNDEIESSGAEHLLTNLDKSDVEEGSGTDAGVDQAAQITELLLSSNNETENSNNQSTRAPLRAPKGEVLDVSGNTGCSAEARDKARICIAPLMKTWLEIRNKRPELENHSFALYKYKSSELLELCDGYANTFLCAGFQSLASCINDELVRFAQDQLGYICSPQNIKRFMQHYDCIKEQEKLNDCQKFVIGEMAPGLDKHKCEGVPEYSKCILPQIKVNCHRGAMNEFEESVKQFGCKVTSS